MTTADRRIFRAALTLGPIAGLYALAKVADYGLPSVSSLLAVPWLVPAALALVVAARAGHASGRARQRVLHGIAVWKGHPR